MEVIRTVGWSSTLYFILHIKLKASINIQRCQTIYIHFLSIGLSFHIDQVVADGRYIPTMKATYRIFWFFAVNLWKWLVEYAERQSTYHGSSSSIPSVFVLVRKAIIYQ